MTENAEVDAPNPDPAGIFACAISLWRACLEAQERDLGLGLSSAYGGMMGLMREVMRIAHDFESWADLRIDFAESGVVWPYEMEDHFGNSVLKILPPDGLREFEQRDCLRVALLMGLSIIFDGTLPLPVDVIAMNPVADSAFTEFRIQTVRTSVDEGVIVPLTLADDPWDESWTEPYFEIYGFSEENLLEHIADRDTYEDAVELLRKLIPGIELPDKPKVGQSAN